MESAELKSKKRVRHCYPRKEVYHRWVHDETLVYHNQHNALWGKYNWLMASWYPPKAATEKDIAEQWGYHREHCIAVIDRDKKRVLINQNWKDHSWGVRRAVPDNYEVFLTNEEIPTPYILKDEEALCKLHVKYLIERFTDYHLTALYNYLAGRTRKVNDHVDRIFNDDNKVYKDIKDFVKKYHLRKYPWSKISLDEKYKIRSSNREWWKYEEQPLPSINKLYTRRIFNKKELRKLVIGYFYSNYCYGNGISLKHLEEHFDKRLPYHVMRNLCNRWHISMFHQDDVAEVDTFQHWIVRIVEVNQAYTNRINEENKAIAKANYEKAKAELDKLVSEVYTVNDWREFKNQPSTSGRGVKYRDWCSYGKDRGWFDNYIPFKFSNVFNNTKLRLSKDGKNRIETSKGASVPFESAKELWRKFIIWINSNNVAENPYFNFESKNIKVGIYNLIFIKYCTKQCDDGRTFYDKEGYPQDTWLIQVGCHRLWLDDILDFINYYKLEKDFPTQYVINPRVKPKQI